MKKLFIIILILFTWNNALADFSSDKHALVIGNSKYKEYPLRNPLNDANDIASTLKKLGFSVLKEVNANQQEMENAIRKFGRRLKEGDIALFYFSGHGVQVNGLNYLIPIGAEIESEDEIRYKAVEAGMVVGKLKRVQSRLNIIILDACRSNPFKYFRSLTRGFVCP